MGGSLFMGILSLIFIAMLAVAFINGMPVIKGGESDVTIVARKLGYIKSVGLFAMVVGILGQLIGLFSAFEYIEAQGSVSPAMLAGGFKVSMIPTLYGLIIYAISLLIWLGLSFAAKKK